MNNYDDIKKYVWKGNGIFFTEDFSKLQIKKYHINKLLEDRIIERYEKGIYIRNDTFEDEYYILQRKNSKIIYSYNTAMFFHQMTERTPTNIDITVYTGYNTMHFPKNVNPHFIKKDNLNLGTIKIKTPQGFEVMAYDLERITCDLIRSRNNGIDSEQTNKFLRKVFFENKIDTLKLIDYSKKLKCEKKVRQVMEVLS